MTTASRSVARTGLTVLVAAVSGASVGIALVEAALVLDFSLAPCPTGPTGRSAPPRSSYLLSVLVLCLVPVGAVVGGCLWGRLPARAWVLVGVAAWATTLALYRVLDGVLNGGLLSPC